MTAVRRCLFAIGALVMTYAVIGALTDTDVKFGALIFLVGVLVAHDGLLLPLTIGAGVLVGRFAPRRLRTLVRVALVVSLAVTVVAFPLALGRGRTSDNPSLLPLSYGRGLLEIYGIIWATAAAALLMRIWRERRRAVPANSSGRHRAPGDATGKPGGRSPGGPPGTAPSDGGAAGVDVPG